MKNPFRRDINYKPTTFNEKQLLLIETIDQELTALHDHYADEPMKIHARSIDLFVQRLPVNIIVKKIQLTLGNAYIPRSVAMISDSTGNWVIYYATRDSTGSDTITTSLFIDILNRTNNARNE